MLVADVRLPSLFRVVVLSPSASDWPLPESWIANATKGMHLTIILTITLGLANVSGQH